MLIVVLVTYGVPILLVILFIRHISRNKREHIKMRLEVGKLADELEQMRKQKDNEKE